MQSWGGSVFRWANDAGEPTGGMTVWSIGEGQNFAPSHAPFMINYRVDDLDALMAQLREEGCNVLESTADPDHGKFGWVLDPEGNKVELWEPPAGM